MFTPLLGQILVLLISLWGIWMILSPMIPKTSRNAPAYPSNEGCLVKILRVAFGSILFPFLWRTISLFATLYHRGLVVSTELMSGVHNWSTSPACISKYLGAVFSFLGYNGLLFSLVILISLFTAKANLPNQTGFQHIWLIEGGLISGAIVSYMVGRIFLRRMP